MITSLLINQHILEYQIKMQISLCRQCICVTFQYVHILIMIQTAISKPYSIPTQKDNAERNGYENRYRTRAIITRGLCIFYPIFHCGLYCRVVYNAKRLIFHDFIFSSKSCFFVVHTTLLRFILQSGLYYKKLS